MPIPDSKKLKTYVDTDVIINLFKEEDHRSKNAMTFFMLCLKNSSKVTLLTSDLLFKEIFGVSKDQDLKISENNVFYKLLENRKNLIKINASPTQIQLAQKFGGNNWKDLLHYILAKQLEADYLVSNNVPHMRLVKTIYAESINEYKKDIIVLRPIEYVKLLNRGENK